MGLLGYCLRPLSNLPAPSFVWLVVCDRVWIGSPMAGLQLMLLLLQPPKYWDERVYYPPCRKPSAKTTDDAQLRRLSSYQRLMTVKKLLNAWRESVARSSQKGTGIGSKTELTEERGHKGWVRDPSWTDGWIKDKKRWDPKSSRTT